MRVLVCALLLLAASVSAADDARRSRADLDIVVPVPPQEHERLHFFDGREHHVLPGTVTIDGSPYECDPHRLRFRDRDVFVAHLRTAHRVTPDRFPDVLVTVKGRVHYIGE